MTFLENSFQRQVGLKHLKQNCTKRTLKIFFDLYQKKFVRLWIKILIQRKKVLESNFFRKTNVFANDPFRISIDLRILE